MPETRPESVSHAVIALQAIHKDEILATSVGIEQIAWGNFLDFHRLVYGTLIVLIISFKPEGIVRLLRAAADRIAPRSPGGEAPARGPQILTWARTGPCSKSST